MLVKYSSPETGFNSRPVHTRFVEDRVKWGTFYFDCYSANPQNPLIYLAPSFYKRGHRWADTYKY